MLNDTDPVGDEPIEEAPKPAAPSTEELTSRAEAAERRAVAAEQDREAWFNRYQQVAQKPQQAAAPAPIIEEADDDDEFDYLDATANNKSRDIDKRIEKRAEKIARQIVEKTMKEGGFVSREQAQQIAVQQAESIRDSAQLVDEYPDLTVEGSPLRAEAMKQLHMLEEDPDYSHMSPIKQARIAAERAQIQLYRQGKIQPVDQNAERQQRIRAQQNTGGNYGAPVQERSDGLSDQQKALAKILGVSEKAYAISAKTHRYRKP